MWFFAAFALAGGAAQFVDGTLGMGFGVTSATILLYMGVSAAAASAATHMAKLPTTFVSGLTDWRQGNVDTATFIRIAIPGGIAAFLGAVVLVNLSLETAKTWMAGLLLFFGFVIMLRFGFNKRLIPHQTGPQCPVAQPTWSPRRLHRRDGRGRLGSGRHPVGDDCHQP